MEKEELWLLLWCGDEWGREKRRGAGREGEVMKRSG